VRKVKTIQLINGLLRLKFLSGITKPTLISVMKQPQHGKMFFWSPEQNLN